MLLKMSFVIESKADTDPATIFTFPYLTCVAENLMGHARDSYS